MDATLWIPRLLGAAVLLPLASFVVIVLAGPRLGKNGRGAGSMATGAILGAAVLSCLALCLWLGGHWPESSHGHDRPAHPVAAVDGSSAEHADDEGGHEEEGHHGSHAPAHEEDEDHGGDEAEDAHHAEGEHDDQGHHQPVPPAIAGEWYVLGEFGKLRMVISYYVDSLTICMFCMVTLIATCIHFYATGYMHDELHDDVTDHEVTMSDGSHLTRPGRYHRFFQSLSLFCFSMLGLVVAGNVAMTFVFWELVGICSYFLIGFYVERKSASNAANKAFITNRVGDFGMIIGLMALWGALGTFSYGQIGDDPGLFELVRPASANHQLVTPLGMVRAAKPNEVAAIVRSMPDASEEEVESAIDAAALQWRQQAEGASPGYWLLIVAGVGIFCGCVGKSAQFPLHVWLPDAMEGPTPVSALVHSATMVAAGVFLVARFFPLFAPEVLLVIAITGTITLFMAATIAITATDIKRVLAYSTVSQLGYMMLALGVGGWLAGVMHLFTHAFFKSLLFMCSGSVIHAVHTNEMPQMGGLRKKMPYTAYTMLIGCLAIAGAGIPFLIGFSGYYSKDAILEQALSFRQANPTWGTFFFLAAAGGAAITAFYMFRLWYLTFAGEPRDQARYDHAHESPKVMYVPLIVLSVFAVGVAWRPAGDGPVSNEALLGSLLAVAVMAVLVVRFGRKPAAATAEDHGHGHDADTAEPLRLGLVISFGVLLIALLWSVFGMGEVTLANLLEQGRPAGTLPTEQAVLMSATWPDEHESHAPAIKTPATLIAFGTALCGFLLATVLYCWRWLDPAEIKSQFSPAHRFLLNKWWFDELYEVIFIRPTHWLSALMAGMDRRCIDWFLDNLAWLVRQFSVVGEKVADQTIVDGSVNKLASVTYATGLKLRSVQTGRLRQYVMFIGAGTVAVFAIASFFWGAGFGR